MNVDSEPPFSLRRTGPTMKLLRIMFEAGSGAEYHGYELAKQLKSHQSAYAIFRKLERLGLVVSRWDEVEGRRRRYYRLSGDGISYCQHAFFDTGTQGLPTWGATS